MQVIQQLNTRKALAQEEILIRLKELADPAMKTIERIMNDPNARPADQLKATEMILSRLVGTKIETSLTKNDETDLDADIAAALVELRPVPEDVEPEQSETA